MNVNNPKTRMNETVVMFGYYDVPLRIARIWAPTTEWYGVKMEFLWKIKNALEKEGIQFPFPQRELWFNNELRSREIKAE